MTFQKSSTDRHRVCTLITNKEFKNTYVAKGGNTATGTNALAAIKAKDKLNVGISELLGKPPPPATPTAADPPVATPLQFDRLF